MMTVQLKQHLLLPVCLTIDYHCIPHLMDPNYYVYTTNNRSLYKQNVLLCFLDSAETSDYPILTAYQPLLLLCKNLTVVLHKLPDSCCLFVMLQLIEILVCEPTHINIMLTSYNFRMHSGVKP